MATSPRKKEVEEKRQKNLEYLRSVLPPGSYVYTVLRSVSRSGMSRVIDCFRIGDDGPVWIAPAVASVTRSRLSNKHQGIHMGGCGMDMGFALVNELAYYLYPNGFECTGEKCPSNDHVNGDRNYEPHHHKSGGYALVHRWL